MNLKSRSAGVSDRVFYSLPSLLPLMQIRLTLLAALSGAMGKLCIPPLRRTPTLQTVSMLPRSLHSIYATAFTPLPSPIACSL